MSTLTDRTLTSTYKGLLFVDNSGNGVDGTLRVVEDGEGTDSALQLSSSAMRVAGDLTVTGTTTLNGIAGDAFMSGADSSTDNAVVRFGGTGGGTIQNSAVIIDDSNNVTGVASLALTTDLAIAHGGTGASTASAARTALGLAIGSNVQAYDADLTALAGLSSSDSNFVVGSASGWVAESGATARTSLGLGSLATASTINNANWSGTDLAVANGGTGQGSYTNGQILVGNTTGNTLAKATITAGAGISVTNGAGAITITSTSSGISMGKAIAAAIVFGTILIAVGLSPHIQSNVIAGEPHVSA